ncbi:MAG: serine hydrolase [Coxiellaceae bacterium]|nr:serine hydrolase [Coxiellaceae bacterium]
MRLLNWILISVFCFTSAYANSFDNKIQVIVYRDIQKYNIPGVSLAIYLRGGLLSTAADIAHWYHSIMTGQVISSRLTNQLTNGVPTNAGFVYPTLVGSKPFVGITTLYYGLAVVKQHLPQYNMDVYFHGGREPGYIGTNMFLPKYKVSFALLSNLENDYIEDPQNEFSADIIAAIVDDENHKKH